MSENLLFACAHCFKRFPFHDLTGDNHYCKSCYRITLRRCSYCQCSFSPENNSQDMCVSCNNSNNKYGLPRSCKVCKLKAAFKGRTCKRCARCCVKYGVPRKCSQCKCRTAFVKSLADLQYTTKLICWLCAHDIKRSPFQSNNNKVEKYSIKQHKSNEKHNSSKALLQKQLVLSPLIDSLTIRTTTTSSTPSPTPSLSYIVAKPMLYSTISPAAVAATITTPTPPTPSSPEPAAAIQHMRSSLTPISTSPSIEYLSANDDVNEMNTQPENLPEALASVMNGETMKTLELPKIKPKSLMIDPFSSEHLIAMTELKDTVAALEKRVFIQNKQLMEKDKSLNLMRAEMRDKEKNLRQQLRDMNSCHMNELANINRKIYALTKENTSLKKTIKDNKSVNLKRNQ